MRHDREASLQGQCRAAVHLAALGVTREDRVALIAGNRPAYLDVVLGALRSGVVPVLLNAHLARGALAELVDDADPVAVVTDDEHTALAPPGRRGVMLDDLLRPAVGSAAMLSDWPLARPMHYTSGTTGRSKGVWSGVRDADVGRALCEDERAMWGFAADDVHLVCSPLFHSAPSRFAINTLLYGGSVVVLPRFDPDALFDAVEQHRVTTTFMVPAQIARVLRHPRMGRADLSSLRLLVHAGAPCPEPLKRTLVGRLPNVVWEFYGSTEGQFTALSPNDWHRRPWSVGRARPNRRLAILDDAGTVLGPGEIGTIWSTAPDFASFTYWNDAEKTAATWRSDGDGHGGRWFTVGDIGAMDDEGYLGLTGRRTDVVITGGVNVYPAEVERVLAGCPGVADCVVFGVADLDWGQRVCAAIVCDDAAIVDPEQVRRWLRDRLAGFQTPKEVIVVAALPRTASGKVLRRELASGYAVRDRGGPTTAGAQGPTDLS